MIVRKILIRILIISVLISLLTVNECNGSIKYITEIESFNLTVRIQDFGAISIDDEGYSAFDSSTAIQNAINYAANNAINSVDFGSSGRYMCKDIKLVGNMTYKANGAVLVCSPSIIEWQAILIADKKSNIVIDGLNIYGNQENVPGTIYNYSPMVQFISCSNVIIKNCYAHDSWGGAFVFSKDSINIDILHNKIQNVDVGCLFIGGVCSYVTFAHNEVLGGKNQYSEPIAIYGTNDHGLSHDIIITDNLLYNKAYSNGIEVLNAYKVLISRNICYGMSSGIDIGIDPEHNGDINISYDITIKDNIIYNCLFGIYGELKDSIISNNTIYSTRAEGIFIKGQNGHKSKNVKIINNKIINSDIKNNNPIIQLSNSDNCFLYGNTLTDIRVPMLSESGILITSNSDGNVIEENVISPVKNPLGCINVYSGKSNVIFNNKTSSIYDSGQGTVVINNDGTPALNISGWSGNNIDKTIYPQWSDILSIHCFGKRVVYNRIANAGYKGRRITIKWPSYSIGSISLSQGNNIKLSNGKTYNPKNAGATLTLISDGTKWVEESRRDVSKHPGDEVIDVSQVSSKTVEVGTTLESIYKPNTIQIKLANGKTTTVGVTWDKGHPLYDGNTKGVYIILGTLIIPKGVINTSNFQTYMKIIVENDYIY